MPLSIKDVQKRHDRASFTARLWREDWRDAYRLYMPERVPLLEGSNERIGPLFAPIFDGTGLTSIEDFSSFVLQSLTPPDQMWVRLLPRADMEEEQRAAFQPEAERTTKQVWSLINRSNYAPAAFAANKDLAIGTSFMEIVLDPYDRTQIVCTPIPAPFFALDEDSYGRLVGRFLTRHLPAWEIATMFKDKLDKLRAETRRTITDNPQELVPLCKAHVFDPETGQWDICYYEPAGDEPLERFSERTCPIVASRWSRTPGQVWGIGPALRALPDLRSLNKTVELILKNASIAVTGIWQADDDGVLNPANIQLVPGAIIPKAVGSSGLTPLEAPGRFDVAQLVLEELRGHINKAFSQIRLPEREMTAYETQERVRQLQRELRGTFAQLKHEDLQPKIHRFLDLGERIGVVNMPRMDLIDLDFISPLNQAVKEAEGMRAFQFAVDLAAFGGQEYALSVIKTPEFIELLRESNAIPTQVVRNVDELNDFQDKLGQLMAQMMLQQQQQQQAQQPGAAPL